MNRSEHFTEEQLTGYYGNSLERETRHLIGRHLLECDLCLSRLSPPTPEQLMAALMTEPEPDEDRRSAKTFAVTRLGFLAHWLRQPKVFALGASALAICLFFSTFLWLSAAESNGMGPELTENFGAPPSVQRMVGDNQTSKSSVLPPPEKKDVASPVPIRAAPPRDLPEAVEIPARMSRAVLKNDSGIKARSKPPTEDKVTISSTRGAAAASIKCGDLLPADLAVKLTNETVILKWKKIPRAVKYHLFVSDDEEILFDEYETERETTYALKKALDAAKTYQWKVLVTLKDGKTIIGDARKFTIRDLRSNQGKSGGQEKNAIRCSESNLNR